MSSQVNHCFSPVEPARKTYRFMTLEDNFKLASFANYLHLQRLGKFRVMSDLTKPLNS
jgi:hypothetical protein